MWSRLSVRLWLIVGAYTVVQIFVILNGAFYKKKCGCSDYPYLSVIRFSLQRAIVELLFLLKFGMERFH
jgi:hypothetical protein